MKALFWIYRTISNKLRRFRKTISLPSCPFELFCHQLRNCFSVARSSVIPWLGKQHDLGFFPTPGTFWRVSMTFLLGGMNFRFEFSSTEKKNMPQSHHIIKWNGSIPRAIRRFEKKKTWDSPQTKIHPFRDLLMLGTDPRIWGGFLEDPKHCIFYQCVNLNWRFLKRILYNFNTSLENKTLHQFTLGLKSYVKENEWHASQLIQDFAQQFHPTLLDLPSPGVSLTSKSSDLKISPPLNHNAIKPPSFDHEILLDELMVFLMWIPHVIFRNSPQIELGPVVHLGGGWESLVEVEEQELTHHWWGFNGKRRD